MRITKKDVRRFLEDLRSGGFRQTHGVMRSTNDDAFCAAGVLAFRVAPQELLTGAGTTEFHGAARRAGLDLGLIEDANDNGATFGQIADAIEREMETGVWRVS